MTISIQVDEQKLSTQAAKALKNAKNKSQFLRDAIEFFVQRELPENIVKQDVRSDLEEIKELIRELHIQSHIAQSSQVINSRLNTPENNQAEESTPMTSTVVQDVIKEARQEIAITSLVKHSDKEKTVTKDIEFSSVEIPSCYDS